MIIIKIIITAWWAWLHFYLVSSKFLWLLSWSAWIFSFMMISKRFFAPRMSLRGSDIVFWMISAVGFTPSKSLLYLLSPMSVMNVVMYVLNSPNYDWRCVFPIYSCWSIFGHSGLLLDISNGCFSHSIAWFPSFISIQTRNPLFRTIAIELTHCIGPSTFSMISSSLLFFLYGRGTS